MSVLFAMNDLLLRISSFYLNQIDWFTVSPVQTFYSGYKKAGLSKCWYKSKKPENNCTTGNINRRQLGIGNRIKNTDAANVRRSQRRIHVLHWIECHMFFSFLLKKCPAQKRQDNCAANRCTLFFFHTRISRNLFLVNPISAKSASARQNEFYGSFRMPPGTQYIPGGKVWLRIND